MLRATRQIGLLLSFGCLLFLPVGTCGQDLGSSTGLFRATNPKTKKEKSEKKSAPARKSKSAVSKSTSTRRSASKRNLQPKGETAAAKTIKKKSATAESDSSAQENIVITVGKPVNDDSSAKNFERVIEEGNAARDARNYVAAESAYHLAQNLKPADSRAIYGLGNLFTDQQRGEEAERAYRQAIALEPDSPEAHIALSFVLTQPVGGANLGDRYAEAEKMARRAIQLDPNNAVAYDQLGAALELSGKVGNETQSAYRQAIKIDPNFALAYAHLGRLLRRIGKTDESDAAYRDAIRLSSDVPTMILVADVMQSQQRFNESEQLLRRALRQDPKNPTALFLLGRALTTRGSFDEAERLLKRSVEVSPHSFVSYTLLSSLYLRRRNFAAAERILMQAMHVVSTNERKRLAQEFELVGDELMKTGKNKDAVRVYRQALTLDGDQPDLLGKLNKAEKS
ncbi:MAG: tetratricopeptide repeat protein [Pyrinomonadaceae bacterium]